MHTLPLSFGLLTYSGYWRPIKWPLYSFKYWAYGAYSIVMFLLLHTIALCTLVDSFISKDLKTMLDKFSLCISVLGVCCKVVNLFLRREKIVSVVNILLNETCIPRDEEERIIQKKFDRHVKKLTICCEILNESAVFFATVAQFQKFLSTRTLPVADWVPYNISSNNLFMITMLYQSLGLMVCANASVAHETLISGLMIQICAQLEILCHRARTLPNLLFRAHECSTSSVDIRRKEKKILSDLVKHHLQVYDFALTVNIVFNLMMFIQFTISSTVLCLSVYKMSTTNPFTVDFVWSFSYLCSMLMQVYLYCWYGSEVTLKSIEVGDAIYEMDWTSLPAHVVKNLLLIIARSRRPIKLSSGYVVVMSTQSFMHIMKVSYTSFNLLKDSSSK